MIIEEDEYNKRTYLVDGHQRLVYWVWSHYGRQGAYQRAMEMRNVVSSRLRDTTETQLEPPRNGEK